MRIRSAPPFLPILVVLVVAATPAAAQSTPDELWRFQGIEDMNAFAVLPDVDGDGIADIVAETYDAGAVGDHLYLLSGGSSGTAAVIWSVRPQSGASDGGGYGQECLVSCSDLNGDGFPDVLLGTAWGNRSVHAIDGLTGAVIWTFDTYSEPESGWVYAVRAHPDRTGDGRPEVIFGAGSNNHRGYLLDGSDGRVIWRFIGATDAIGYTASLPDMDGDGIADVLFCGWDNEYRVFCVSGAGGIVGEQIWASSTGSSNHAATVIDDINGDGIAEIVVGTWRASNQVVCLDGATGGTLWTYHVGTYEYVMRLVTSGDLDGDGVRDVIVGSWSNGLPAISGRTGGLIWQSYAGTLNGGDFWTVDTIGDLDGDGIGDLIGGSFDYNVYLFSGASGDTLWTYNTGNRLYSVFGGPDLSGNLKPDVLAGTQYQSGGGRAYALEGGMGATPVPDLPEASGRAVRLAGGIEVRWLVSQPLPCVVDRFVDDAGKARAERFLLQQAFERGELKTHQVLDAVRTEKAQGAARITPAPLLPAGEATGGWVYRLDDPQAPAGSGVRYRISAILPGGGEAVLLELAPGAEVSPRRLLLAANVAPNPFNPRAEIRLTLDRPAVVTVDIHDARGRRVAAIGPRNVQAGETALTWDGIGFSGRDLAAGIYVMHIRAGGESRMVKAALVR